MKLKFILFIVLTSLSIRSESTEPVLPIFLVPETLNPAFAGTLITEYTGLIHRSQWPNETRRIDTEYAINGPGPERNMGLGLTILNQREVFYQL
jgi:hypothetical protein